MGWAYCGEDDLGRPIGYGVAALCDAPSCNEEIDRGLAYCCGNMHGGGEFGCGRYFCDRHLWHSGHGPLCEACNDAFYEAHPYWGEDVAPFGIIDNHTPTCVFCAAELLYIREVDRRRHEQH